MLFLKWGFSICICSLCHSRNWISITVSVAFNLTGCSNLVCSNVVFWIYSDFVLQKGYSSLLSFTVTDINSTVTKLMALGAELDGSIKYEIHGKVTEHAFISRANNCGILYRIVDRF